MIVFQYLYFIFGCHIQITDQFKMKVKCMGLSFDVSPASFIHSDIIAIASFTFLSHTLDYVFALSVSIDHHYVIKNFC